MAKDANVDVIFKTDQIPRDVTDRAPRAVKDMPPLPNNLGKGVFYSLKCSKEVQKMSLDRINDLMVNVMSCLLTNMGNSTLRMKFEDFNLAGDQEKYFDAMIVWMVSEGLIRLSDSRQLASSNTEISYALLIKPSITALGAAVYSLAVNQMHGDVVAASALITNPQLKNFMSPDMAGCMEREISRLSGVKKVLKTET